MICELQALPTAARMDSQQEADGLQPQEELNSCWTVLACATVQDITAALKASYDDTHPINDVPTYQVLCVSAREACCQAEASTCSSTQQGQPLQPKELDCVCQLSTATLQLSSAVCCDPSVALPLVSSGSHTAALEQLKGAVKSLTNLWAALLSQLQQLQQDNALSSDTDAAAPQHACSGNHSQQLWRAISPSLTAALTHLLDMSVTSAEFINSGANGASSQQVPREMCSMSALNLAWANLTRLLVSVPEGLRAHVLSSQDLLRGLKCALQQLQSAVMELPVQARDRQEVLVRFWLQSVSRLTSAAWQEPSQQALAHLLQLTLKVYEVVAQQREEFAGVQDILEQLLQPRLLACVSTLLSTSTDPADLHAKLDLLLQPAALQDSPSLQQQHQGQVKAQVLLVLDLLQSALAGWPLELVVVASVQLLTWVLCTTGRDLMEPLLCGDVSADVLVDGDGSGGAAGVAGLVGHELLQVVLQGCLIGLVTCWGLLQELHQQQLELLAAINKLALSRHPLVSFLARQLLADLVAAAGDADLTLQQLDVLHKLLGAAAAAAAVPGARLEASHAAAAVADTLAMVLQVCDSQLAAQWLKEHFLQGISCDHDNSSNSSSNGSWLDAGACTLLVQECAVLQRLASTAPECLPVGPAEVEACWSRLWTTAQQVAELLEPQQLLQALQQEQQQQHGGASNSGSPELPPQHAYVMLILHQLQALFSAMHNLLHLCLLLDAALAASLKQGAAPLALEVLQVLSAGAALSGSGCATAAAAPACAAAAQYACTAAVLRLLAVPGQLSLPEGDVKELLGLLQAASDREGLHCTLAGVLGGLGSAANSGNATFQALFHSLLQSPHWAVQHAAFDALLQLLRHGGLGTGIVCLLPASMRSSDTEAMPEVVNIVKAHLHKQPDPQAQAAFCQHYPQLAWQHQQQLSALAPERHGSRTAAGSSACPQSPATCLPAAARLQGSVSALDQLLAACGAAEGSTQGPGQEGVAAEAPSAAAAAAAQGRGDGGAGAQPVLAQAAVAARSLQAAEQALAAAESDVNLLLAAASAAARDHELGAEGILLVSKQGTVLTGSVASLISRLRAMQDGLSTLRR